MALLSAGGTMIFDDRSCARIRPNASFSGRFSVSLMRVALSSNRASASSIGIKACFVSQSISSTASSHPQLDIFLPKLIFLKNAASFQPDCRGAPLNPAGEPVSHPSHPCRHPGSRAERKSPYHWQARQLRVTG